MKKLIITLVLILLILQITFFLIMSKANNLVFFDTLLMYDYDVFKTSMAKYHQDIILNDFRPSQYVTAFYAVDTIFPLMYGLLIGVLLYRYAPRFMVAFIIIAVGFDFLENGLIIFSYHHTPSVIIFYSLHIVTKLKFIFIFTSIILIIKQMRKV
ncbi:MAG: hypothetical protein K9L26_05030 [Candidatus Izimaplasma sp.]|nr:hypothetical protein [Candidatus Izimaplasma bacterium]